MYGLMLNGVVALLRMLRAYRLIIFHRTILSVLPVRDPRVGWRSVISVGQVIICLPNNDFVFNFVSTAVSVPPAS